MIAYGILALVATQRLAELFYAQHNTKALLARGGIEIGRKHYPVLVGLHAAWLIAIALALPRPAPLYWAPLSGYIALQALRVWTVTSLGPFWTTRIITVPGAPLVRRGPYRFVRHPNYLIVTGEIALLPLVFGEVWVAILFTILNAIALYWRVREEETALSQRRSL
ncbi:MAG TPA: isoprenylcysteine carboxylmethyltransferase family protein [Rhizomicrobium sp.]